MEKTYNKKFFKKKTKPIKKNTHTTIHPNLQNYIVSDRGGIQTQAA